VVRRLFFAEHIAVGDGRRLRLTVGLRLAAVRSAAGFLASRDG